MGLASLVAGRIMRQIVRCQSRQKHSVNGRQLVSFSDGMLWFINAASVHECMCVCVCIHMLV